MAREFVTQSGRFYCISLKPDICKTPVGPATHAVPYTVKGEFAEANGVSPSVSSGGAPLAIHASTLIPTVTGDEPGTAKGVKSQTVRGKVEHDSHSSTVTFNGERAVRVGDTVFMNERNTIGKVFARPASATAIDQTSEPEATVYPAPPPGSSVAGKLALQRLADAFGRAARSTGFLPADLLGRIPGLPISTGAGSPAAEPQDGGSKGKNESRIPLAVTAGRDGGTSLGKGGGASGPRPPAARQAVRPISSKAELRQEFPGFPVWAADILMKNNVKIWRVQDSVVEAFPKLGGVWPRGYPANETYDHVGGVCLDDGKSVAIARSDRYPSKSFDMPFHELAHAVDIAGNFSHSEKFIAAWGKDYDALGSAYFKGVSSGYAETFAEGFARYYKGGGADLKWPNIAKYFKALDACMANGASGC